jgi:hypothetical protein
MEIRKILTKCEMIYRKADTDRLHVKKDRKREGLVTD